MDPSKETILFEYIPRVLYTKQVLNGSKVDIGSDSGVIMIVMLNGDVFFYPSNITLLDQLPDIFMNSPNSNNNSSNNNTSTTSTTTNINGKSASASSSSSSSSSSSASSNNSKKSNLKSKYNIPLNLSPEHKVFTFDFKQVDPSENYIYHPDSTTNSTTNAFSASKLSATFNSDSEDDIEEKKSSKVKSKKKKNKKSSSNKNIEDLDSDEINESEAQDFLDFNPIRYRRPRKIIVSHDKKLLLIIGCFIKGISSLAIYKIMEEGPNYFQLLFYDTSFTYIDACFSSDSTSMASILARYPNFIFILQIPGLQLKQIASSPSSNQSNCNIHNSNDNDSKSSLSPSSSTSTSTSSSPIITSFASNNKDDFNFNNNNNNKQNFVETLEYQEKRINFETRKIGPLAIVGPVKNCFGQAYHMSHITSNPNMTEHEKLKPYEYVTWNDDGLGEYCFWNVFKELASSPSGNTNNTSTTTTTSDINKSPHLNPTNSNSPLKNIPSLKFEWLTKFISPIIPDRNWIEKETSPKSFIISMEFSPNGDLVNAIVRRENHDQKNKFSNGIGFQCVPSTLQLLKYSRYNPDGTLNHTTNLNNIISTPNQNNFKNKNLNPQLMSTLNSYYHQLSQQQSQQQQQQQNSNNKLIIIGGENSSQWYQLSESNDKSIIITSKWSDSLFFGGANQYLPAVLIKEKGIFELVSNNYCVQFTNSSEEFTKTCVNFIQMGKYHRLWISTYGILYSITMTPKNDKYIDWISTVFESSNSFNLNQLKYFKVSQMIGYTLIDFNKNKSTNQDSSKNFNKKRFEEVINNKKVVDVINNNTSIDETTGMGNGEIYNCLHLYKCWSCKLTLIKPLICGFCKTVAYCSKECQKDHWVLTHKDQCIPPSLPIIHHTHLQQLHQQHQQLLQQRLQLQHQHHLNQQQLNPQFK